MTRHCTICGSASHDRRRHRNPNDPAFRKLERRVEREYERKGYSPARAEYIGRAVAGQIALRKRMRKRR